MNFNGLDVHLERIYWLEDQCRQLSQSNSYYRKTACSKDAFKQRNDSPDLQKELIQAKNKIKAQEIANDLINQERSELKIALTEERQKSSSLVKELNECQKLIQNYSGRKQI